MAAGQFLYISRYDFSWIIKKVCATGWQRGSQLINLQLGIFKDLTLALLV